MTATASGGVVLSKYVGRGGFRLRIDGIGDATPEEIHVAPGTLRALGLANDDDTDPLCVVAAGVGALVAGRARRGFVFAGARAGRPKEWKAMVEDVVAAEAPCKGESHPFLAVRERRPCFFFFRETRDGAGAARDAATASRGPRTTQGWRDAPDGAELFAEGSDARNELKRLEAWLQTTEFRVKVDDERSRRGVRDGAFDRGGGARWRRGCASSLLERRFD